MDNEKIGRFIAECRKNKGITQSRLAETLNITNKAVSKWETGAGIPDVALLPELAKALQVTVDEILAGERTEKSAFKDNDAVFSFETAFTEEAFKSMYSTYMEAVRGRARLLVLIIAAALIIAAVGLFVMTRPAGPYGMYYTALVCTCASVCLFAWLVFYPGIKARLAYSVIRVKNGNAPTVRYMFYNDSFKCSFPSGCGVYRYERLKAVIEADGHFVIAYPGDMLYVCKNDTDDAEAFAGFLFEKCKNSARFEKYHKKMPVKRRALCCAFGILTALFGLWQLGYVLLAAFTMYGYLYAETERVVFIMFMSMLTAFLISLFYDKKRALSISALCCGGLIAGSLIFFAVYPVSVKTYVSSCPDGYSEIVLKRDEWGEVWQEARTHLLFSADIGGDWLKYPAEEDMRFEWLTDHICVVTYKSLADGSIQQHVVSDIRSYDTNLFFDTEGESVAFQYDWVSDTGQKWRLSEKNGMVTLENGSDAFSYDLDEAVTFGSSAIVLTDGGEAKWTLAENDTVWLSERFKVSGSPELYCWYDVLDMRSIVLYEAAYNGNEPVVLHRDGGDPVSGIEEALRAAGNVKHY